MKSVLILLQLTKIVFCVFSLANHHGGCFYYIIENTLNLDCQRFLFFFRFSKGISHATRREKRGWQPKKRKERLPSLFFRASPVSRLQSRPRSFSCLVRFARRTKKKERPLEVYFKSNKKRNDEFFGFLNSD